MHRVAVYGTLRKGFRAEGLLSTSKFLHQVGIYPGNIWYPTDINPIPFYRSEEQIPFVFTLGAPSHAGFPAVVAVPREWGRVTNMPNITVEIYEVDDAVLNRLDRYEGFPTLYGRGVAEYYDPDTCEDAQTFIYVMNIPSTHLDDMYFVESGDWSKFNASESKKMSDLRTAYENRSDARETRQEAMAKAARRMQASGIRVMENPVEVTEGVPFEPDQPERRLTAQDILLHRRRLERLRREAVNRMFDDIIAAGTGRQG